MAALDSLLRDFKMWDFRMLNHCNALASAAGVPAFARDYAMTFLSKAVRRACLIMGTCDCTQLGHDKYPHIVALNLDNRT